MKINENPWKSMKIHGNRWTSMKINENRMKIGRNPMATSPDPEKVRKSNDSVRRGLTKTMKIRGWPYKSKINENSSKSRKINENSSKSIKINEIQWKSMKINENQWKSSKIKENQWKSMKINENWGKSMKCNDENVLAHCASTCCVEMC